MSHTEKKFAPRNSEESMHERDYLAVHRRNLITSKTLMADGSREKHSLNGSWHFSIDQYDTCLRAGWYKFSHTESILENYKEYFSRYGVPDLARKAMSLVDLVKLAGKLTPHDFNFDAWDTLDLPASWNVKDPSLFWYEGPMVFTREFDWKNKKNRRLWLKIGGANYQCTVILNGKPVGLHKGGSTGFYVELTNFVHKKNNRLILVVDATRRGNQVPMENTDWFNYGGIHREIELIETPVQFIRNYKCELVPDGSFSKIKIQAELSEPGKGRLFVSIPELSFQGEMAFRDGRCASEFELVNIELWSPANPKLYDVNFLFKGDHSEDNLTDRIGFRQVEVKGTAVYLNGNKIFLKGVSCHEESVENGRTLSRDEIIENFKLAKEMGCNFMRLAHYPHNALSACLADEMGILLWEEIPVYWAIAFENKETYQDAANQLSELVKRDWNRASVIIWSVGNENEDSDERLKFMGNLVDLCRNLDPYRLVSAACLVNWRDRTLDDRLADKLDIIGQNEYFGWYEPGVKKLKDFFDNSNIDKPVVISEFGAGMKWGYHGSKKTFFTEEKHQAVYKEQVEIIAQIPQIAGTSPWILYDFRCPRRNNGLQYFYNLKGLLTADKKNRKPGFYIMQEFYNSKN